MVPRSGTVFSIGKKAVCWLSFIKPSAKRIAASARGPTAALYSQSPSGLDGHRSEFV
jgi:hypothetical protein